MFPPTRRCASGCDRTSGRLAHLWIVDAAGDGPSIGGALTELAAGPFKDKNVKALVNENDSTPRVEMLHTLIARAFEAAKARGTA